MSSILNFTLTEARRLLPTAIGEAGSFYQESLRGTDSSEIVPAMIGRGAYHATTSLDSKVAPYAGLVGSLGLAWAIGAYKGLGIRTWIKDWASVAALPTVNRIIEYVTPNAERRVKNKHGTSVVNRNYSQNQERARFVLKTAAMMVQACALYKLQVNRNGSISLKPYLYYGATVTLLNQLTKRYMVPRLQDELKARGYDLGKTSVFMLFSGFLALQLSSRINIASLVAKFATGETVEVSKKWELLTFVARVLALRYI